MRNPSSVIAKDKHAGHVKFNLTESDTGIFLELHCQDVFPSAQLAFHAHREGSQKCSVFVINDVLRENWTL